MKKNKNKLPEMAYRQYAVSHAEREHSFVRTFRCTMSTDTALTAYVSSCALLADYYRGTLFCTPRWDTAQLTAGRCEFSGEARGWMHSESLCYKARTGTVCLRDVI